MKATPSSLARSPFFAKSYRSRRSSALIIVLACLVFISVLILAFFASVTTERQSAQFYANSSSVKLLADSTLSIVMGQIVNATRGTDASGNTLSWASQPGMIRNYNLQGTAAGYFKLYSSTNMVGTASFNPFSSAEQVPTSWTASPAIYTDLNDPIVSGSSGSITTNYPIVDPAATNSVVGFSISNTAPTSTTDGAPMPVQWLYVLQQGQVIGPDPGGNGTNATFVQAATHPSASNPIVGRVAFWTDDDTSKININTAAGDAWNANPGSFWDTPRIYSPFEQTNLASFQPANGEYQRYPGHPATVYLSAVFSNILTNPSQIYTSTSTGTGITPRVAYGGSQSGTTYPPASMFTTTPAQVASSRLYDSVDELLTSTTLTGGTRNLNSPLTKASVERAKFFLTAVSRAPEVNLFNEPRVIVWPVSSNNTAGTYRTPYDNLIAYCGTLNGNLYYFQRGVSSPSAGTGAFSSTPSTTTDLPPTTSTSATIPATDLTRNRQLITYLRNLTSLAVPGFSTSGETFKSKYPMDRDEILTEMFDYIRSLNTQDINVSTPYTPVYLSLSEGQIFPITDTSHADSNTTSLRGFGHMPIVTEASLLFVGTGQTSTTGSATFYANNSGETAPAAGNTRIKAALLLKFFDPSQGYAPYNPNFKVTVTGLSGLSWNGTSMGFKDPATITVKTYVANTTNGTGGEIGITPCVWATGYPANLVSGNYLDTASGTMTLPGTFTFTESSTFTVSLTDTLGNTLQTYSMQFPGGTFPVPGMAPYVKDPGGVYGADFRNLVTTTTGTLPTVNGRFSPNANSSELQTFACGTDVVRSIALTTDPRMIVPLSSVPLTYTSGANAGNSVFAPVAGYNSSTTLQAHGILDSINGNHRPLVGFVGGSPLVPNVAYSGTLTALGDFTYVGSLSQAWGTGVQINVDSTVNTGTWKATAITEANVFSQSSGYTSKANGVFISTPTGTIPGDWDTGNGDDKDGAYINKADEGNIPYAKPGLLIPYFGAGYNTSVSTGSIITAAGANFSPNRQMPSAGMFGSLPTGVFSNAPWQTLLFRPSPDGNVLPSESPGHIGAQSPQDHLFLDLFNMPIVEPYAISDPFSTAGKINMNYQIVPFTYLTRSTAVQAAMRGEQIRAIPGTAGTSYKGGASANYLYFLDLNQTLTGFTNMFTTGTPDATGSTPDIFRSASQICNIWLVPTGKGLTYASGANSATVANSVQALWLDTTNKGGILTGDNVRERPYANLYQKLTTKSNTYTVHMRVQTLKAVKSVDPTFTTWVEGSDTITGEYRGSSTIERYLDTSSTSIPDYATLSQPLTAGQAIDNFYKFRVVETKQFTP